MDFIVVDDNKVDCFIAEKTIENSGKGRKSDIFYEAAAALEYIKSLPPWPPVTIVLVDIQMPVMNGFEFVEEFECLPLIKRGLFHIYALSSSINEQDITRIQRYSSVKGFLNKPLTVDTINQVVKATSL